jgi:hypothetical protein
MAVGSLLLGKELLFLRACNKTPPARGAAAIRPTWNSAIRACARADRSTLRDQVGPIRLAAICAALTKNYAGSNQPSPGSVPPSSAWDRIKLQTFFRLVGFGFILPASQGWPRYAGRRLLIS